MEKRWNVFRLVTFLHERVEALLMWLVYPLVGVMVAEIIARYVFLRPLPWARDVSLWLFAVPFMLAIAHYYNKRSHISAEDLVYAFKLTDGQRAFIDLVHNVILLSIAGFIFCPAVQAVMQSFRLRELSAMTTWRPIIWPFRAVIPAAMLLLGVQAVIGVVESLQKLGRVGKQ